MAHPYKSAAHKNDPKWVKRAFGGPVIRTRTGGAPDQSDQDNSNPSRFTGTHDFDDRNVGVVGPDYRDAQADEIGLSRRLSAKNRTAEDDARADGMFKQREDRQYKRGGKVNGKADC